MYLSFEVSLKSNPFKSRNLLNNEMLGIQKNTQLGKVLKVAFHGESTEKLIKF